MPEKRLQKVRESYDVPQRSITAADIFAVLDAMPPITDRIVPDTDPVTGFTVMRRMPRPFTVA